MKKTLLYTYLLFITINLIVCYDIPPADFVIYPKGFSISIPDEQGIEVFFFYGSVNNVTCAFQTDSIIMSTSKNNGEKWVLENNEVYLSIGHIIYYWLHVKKDGMSYIKQANFYNVTDILPFDSEYPTVQQSDTLNLQAAETQLNLDPYHVKKSNAVTQRILEKLPSEQKPALNLNPFKPQVTHNNAFFQPVSQKVPLNLDPIYVKSTSLIPEKHIFPSVTPPSYYLHQDHLNTSSIRANNCSSVLEEETSSEPFALPLGTNQDNSKEFINGCKQKHTSTKFNPNYPPGSNQYGNKPGQDYSTESSKGHVTADVWYWSRK